MTLDRSSPSLLFENGAGAFQSDLASAASILANGNQLSFLTFQADNSLTFASVTNAAFQQTICQKPVATSYCIDLPSLNTAMTKAGISYIGIQQQSSTASMSPFSCLQYCKTVPANVGDL